MKKTTTQRIKNYGALSATILAAGAASGQVVYTDIPDETLTLGGGATGGAVQIDLNDDAEIDFSIFFLEATNGVGFTARAGGEAGPNDPPTTNVDGAFIGIPAGGFQYPALLAPGDIIDDTSDQTDPGARGDLNFYGCAYSNSQFCGTNPIAYMGLVFAFNGNTHYGWVELDYNITSSTEGTVTVKSFAFDATPNAPVTVGQTLGVNDNAFTSFEYFVDSSNNLNLKAASSMDNVILHNTLGQQVLSQKLSNSNELVNLNALKSGVYLATVSIEGKAKSFKIVKK
jgi:hypothetical protein